MLFERIVNNYIKRHWGIDYIERSMIAQEIVKAREDEKGLQNSIWGKRLEEQRLQLIQEKEIAVAVVVAENTRLLKELEEIDEKRKASEALYNRSVRSLKSNLQFSIDLGMEVKHATDVMANIFGNIKAIERDSTRELKQLEQKSKNPEIELRVNNTKASLPDDQS